MSLAQLLVTPTVPGRVHRVGFGWINVGGRTYEQDRVLHPQGVSAPWWRRPRHRVGPGDALELLQAHRPARLVIGVGWMGMLRVDVAALQPLLDEFSCALTLLRTGEAVVQYQQMLSRGERAVAALHLTC